MSTKWPRPPHILNGSNFTNLMRLLSRHGGQIDLRYWPRMLITCGLVASGAPSRLIEQLVVNRRLRQPLPRAVSPRFAGEPESPADPHQLQTPLFILGHWRSGTTNMQNLLMQDRRWGTVNLEHCLIPGYFLVFGGLLRKIAGLFVPASRPMDNVPTGLDEPMSEDFGLVGLSDLTHYSGYFFPREFMETFRRCILFEGVSETEIARWERTYLDLLKKVTLQNGGKRLLLKNPPHTGRVPALLRMFPDARIVYLRRNPCTVYASTCKLQDRFLQRFSLQKYDLAQVKRELLTRQRITLERFERDKALIPPGQLLEVHHEDVIANQIDSVAAIYRHFGIDGFEEHARPGLTRYVESIAGYETNEYKFDPETLAALQSEVGHFIKAWGYNPPEQAKAS